MTTIVVLEGLDGAGKTTLAYKLKKYYESSNYKVALLKEPNTTEYGNTIRKMLLKKIINDAYTEMLLFLSAIRNDIITFIKEKINQNYDLILVDRWYYSTIAYQGYGNNLDIDLIKFIASNIIDHIVKPNTVLYLDIDIETMMQRIQKKMDEFTKYNLEQQNYFEKVRNGYLQMLEDYAYLFHKIDATQDQDKVMQIAISIINGMLKK